MQESAMPLMFLLIASLVAPSIDVPWQKTAKALVEEGQKLLRDGDVEQALARFKDAVAAAPDLFDAQYGAGRAFDLVGDHRAARYHLERAITLAPDDARNQALSAMGISYAFEARADDAARYYQRVFDAQIQADDRPNASATANAIGRIYLESGNLRKAEQWYRTGYETGKKVSQQPAAAMALVEMRWRNAMGRLAARRGDRKAALAHAGEAKAQLDAGGNAGQQPFYPYLLGYIAFYARDYRGAVTELAQGDQDDPFVLGLTAQAYEKLGDKVKAREFYTKVMASPAHSINAAFARPRARAFLSRSAR
jgi:tetratricopeptide (TPR) repeat protein